MAPAIVLRKHHLFLSKIVDVITLIFSFSQLSVSAAGTSHISGSAFNFILYFHNSLLLPLYPFNTPNITRSKMQNLLSIFNILFSDYLGMKSYASWQGSGRAPQ